MSLCRLPTLLASLLAFGLLACSDSESSSEGGGDAADVTDDRARDSESDATSDLTADTPSDGAGGDAPEDASTGDRGAELGLDDSGGDVPIGDDGTADTGGDGSSDDSGSGDGGLDTPLDDQGGDAVELGCGGWLGDTCTDDQYCDFPDDLCGAADGSGVCRPRPETCTLEYLPVCGCDGQTHSNACRAAAMGADVSTLGGCEAPEGWTPCSSGFCLLEFSYCFVFYPGMPGPASYSCPELPDCEDPTSCECLGEIECGDCVEREDGSLQVSCFAP